MLYAGVEIFWVSNIAGGGGQQLFFGVAEHLAQRAVYLCEPSVELIHGHAYSRVVERAAEAFLRFVQLLLLPLALRDVAYYSREQDVALFAHLPQRELQRKFLAALAQSHELDRTLPHHARLTSLEVAAETRLVWTLEPLGHQHP